MDNLEGAEGVQQEAVGTVGVYCLPSLDTKSKKGRTRQPRQKEVVPESADADTTPIAITKPVATPRKRRREDSATTETHPCDPCCSGTTSIGAPGTANEISETADPARKTGKRWPKSPVGQARKSARQQAYNVQLDTRTLISSLNNLSVQVRSVSSGQSQIFAKMQEMLSAQQAQVEQVDKRVRNIEVQLQGFLQAFVGQQNRDAQQSMAIEIDWHQRRIDQLQREVDQMHASNSSLCQPTSPSMDNHPNVHKIQGPPPQQSPLLPLPPPPPTSQQKQQQQQQQQQEQEGDAEEHLSPWGPDERTKGYLIIPDNGLLTLRKVWDEFHGPIEQAKRQDKKWPYTEARRKAYRRRKTLIKLIRSLASEQDQPIETFVDDLSTQYKDKTINWVRLELEKTIKCKGKDV